MTYDQHGPWSGPGPIASLPGVKRELAYFVTASRARRSTSAPRPTATAGEAGPPELTVPQARSLAGSRAQWSAADGEWHAPSSRRPDPVVGRRPLGRAPPPARRRPAPPRLGHLGDRLVGEGCDECRAGREAPAVRPGLQPAGRSRRSSSMGGEDLRRRLLAGLQRHGGRGGAGRRRRLPALPRTRSNASSRWSPSPYLREKACLHTATSGCELRDDRGLRAARSGDGEADAVVFSLVLCSVDQPSALAEARRVLRPGGQLRVPRARAGPRARARPVAGQRALDADRVGHACPAGATSPATRWEPSSDAGFEVTELERFQLPRARPRSCRRACGPRAAPVRG